MVGCFLRPATENDVDLLYEWVCDEDVRKNSLNSAHIIYDEHKKWFSNKILSDKSEIFIYCCGDKPIGQIRVEIEGDNATISYSIEKSYRGQGHGENILILLENTICDKYPHIKKLTAIVKADNTASMKKFEKLNYTKKDKVYEYSKNKLEQSNIRI